MSSSKPLRRADDISSNGSVLSTADNEYSANTKPIALAPYSGSSSNVGYADEGSSMTSGSSMHGNSSRPRTRAARDSRHVGADPMFSSPRAPHRYEYSHNAQRSGKPYSSIADVSMSSTGGRYSAMSHVNGDSVANEYGGRGYNHRSQPGAGRQPRRSEVSDRQPESRWDAAGDD
eukprot:Lankesteria_metandrocarpae@DN6942_c0_g1_i1.p1